MIQKIYGINPIESYEERAAIFETGREGYRRGRRGIWKACLFWFVFGATVGAMLMGSYMVRHPYTIREIRCNNENVAMKNQLNAITHERDGLMLMFAEKKGVERDIAIRSLQ